MKPRFIDKRDWICPYCRVVAYNGENKLRHLSSHEPAIRKLIKKEFIQNLTLGAQAWDKVESDIEL